MHVLITSAGSRLGRVAAQAINVSGHSVRLTHHSRFRSDYEVVQSQLGHGKATDRLVKDIDVVVHIPDPGPNPTSAAWIDAGTRRSYNLYTAAVNAGVQRLIYISTLDLFTRYDEDMVVSESWRPLPSTDSEQMGIYLGEFVGEEFAQEKRLAVTFLRLGHLVKARNAKKESYDPMWLEFSDAAQAITAAVDRSGDMSIFQIFHVQSASPKARFRIEAARSALDFNPKHNFV